MRVRVNDHFHFEGVKYSFNPAVRLENENEDNRDKERR